MKRLAVAVLLALAACTNPKTPAVQPPTSSPSASPSASATGLDLTFAVKGDWGAGSKDQAAVTQRMCAQRSITPFRFVVTTGDNFYNPDGLATAKNFFTPERCLLGPNAVVWRSSWGNHDVARSSTRSSLGARRYYSWSAGGIDFFALDSNDVGGTAQRQWIRRSLAASKARAKIVYFHHPPYTAGLHAPNRSVQSFWVPLFERYHVTLVLTGHNHDYEHLVVNGIDYVVTGGGGASTYPCVRSADGLKKCTPVHHFLLVTAAGQTIAVRAILPNGKTLDAFSIAI